MELYPRFPIHKVPLHNKQIMEKCILPVEYLGEKNPETKFIKKTENIRPEKIAELITKIFQRTIDTSDPLISSLSLQPRRLKLKIKKLPEEVLTCWNHDQPENLNITTDDSQSNALDLESFLGSKLDSLELDSELQNI